MISLIKNAGPCPINYVKQFVKLDAKLDPDLSSFAFRKTVKNTKNPDKKNKLGLNKTVHLSSYVIQKKFSSQGAALKRLA
jgi:hypothetical protein